LHFRKKYQLDELIDFGFLSQILIAIPQAFPSQPRGRKKPMLDIRHGRNNELRHGSQGCNPVCEDNKAVFIKDHAAAATI